MKLESFLFPKMGGEKKMAVNVGEAVAHLTLDTSRFKTALNGAGKDLEIFVHKVEEEKN